MKGSKLAIILLLLLLLELIYPKIYIFCSVLSLFSLFFFLTPFFYFVFFVWDCSGDGSDDGDK